LSNCYNKEKLLREARDHNNKGYGYICTCVPALYVVERKYNGFTTPVSSRDVWPVRTTLKKEGEEVRAGIKPGYLRPSRANRMT
jgi:hypothetical protein